VTDDYVLLDIPERRARGESNVDTAGRFAGLPVAVPDRRPVLAIGIAWVWLREIPTWLSLIGGLITIAGVALANLRRRSPPRSSA